MILPPTRSFTLFQKWLLVSVACLLLVLCGVGIRYYEKHYRTSDDIFVGTWEFPSLSPPSVYFHLKADHTFTTFEDALPEKDSPMKGRWFGEGSVLYFLQPVFDRDGFVTNHPLYFWRVEGISKDELHIRLNPSGIPRTVRRVDVASD